MTLGTDLLDQRSGQSQRPDFTVPPDPAAVSIPATFTGVLLAALWSIRRGKDLDKDPVFQAKLADPEERDYIYAGGSTLLDRVFPRSSYVSVGIFLSTIVAIVIFGAFSQLLPTFTDAAGKTARLSMTPVIRG